MQIMLFNHSLIKLGMKNKKITGKVPYIWKLTNTILHNSEKYFYLENDKNTTYHCLAVLNSYIRKEEKYPLKKLDKKQKNKSKVNRRKEILIKMKIKEIKK